MYAIHRPSIVQAARTQALQRLSASSPTTSLNPAIWSESQSSNSVQHLLYLRFPSSARSAPTLPLSLKPRPKPKRA